MNIGRGMYVYAENFRNCSGIQSRRVFGSMHRKYSKSNIPESGDSAY